VTFNLFNLIEQKLNVDSFSACSVLCDMSITLLKRFFWGPTASLVLCYGCIIVGVGNGPVVTM